MKKHIFAIFYLLSFVATLERRDHATFSPVSEINEDANLSQRLQPLLNMCRFNETIEVFNHGLCFKYCDENNDCLLVNIGQNYRTCYLCIYSGEIQDNYVTDPRKTYIILEELEQVYNNFRRAERVNGCECREADHSHHCRCQPQFSQDIGHSILQRSMPADNALRYTFVDNQEFTESGVIKAVHFYAGAGGRPLKIGIYRLQNGVACNYELVSSREFNNIQQGVNQIELPSRDWIEFERGDRFGLAWTNRGVVSWDSSSTVNYCAAAGMVSVGEVRQMSGGNVGKRIYSFSVRVLYYD